MSAKTSEYNLPPFVEVGEAEARLFTQPKNLPITVIGTKVIRDGFDQSAIKQAINTRQAPGVTDVVLNPDAHSGYGAPIGCVLVSPDHIYPGPVGVDIKCSMSLLQLNVPDEEIADKCVRRAIIDAICARTPTGAGAGSRSVPLGPRFSREVGMKAVTQGASFEVCHALDIPAHWAKRCEDAVHVGHDEKQKSLEDRMDWHIEERTFPNLTDKLNQLGSYGGGNHFGECNTVSLRDDEHAQKVADVFGLKDGKISFLSHCGSRGFGNMLAVRQFQWLKEHFNKWNTPFPGGDSHMVYAPLGTPQANAYLDDMALGANFATVNHLLINKLVLDAFQEVIPGAEGELVYFISHNIARQEVLKNEKVWVHRKGATRAYPGGHFALKGTPFAETGHPILLPGNPRDGSAVMVAAEGAEKSCYSVNHGAGRTLSRSAAFKTLNQKEVDREFDEHDILSNARRYPLDEAPAAYKDFKEVLRSVELAGLATMVADLKARFVIKDHDKSLKGAA